MRKGKLMKELNTVTMILFVIAIIALIHGFVAFAQSQKELKRLKEFSAHTYELTEEEMAARPVKDDKTKIYKPIETIKQSAEAQIEDGLEVYKTFSKIPLSEEEQILMQSVCKDNNVSFPFALAIMESESSFRHYDSDGYILRGDNSKSIGYMQINEPNWYKYGFNAHFEMDNITIGVTMLGDLIEKYRDIDAVIMAYKGGETFANNWISDGRKLDCCDDILERMSYWQSVVDGEE